MSRLAGRGNPGLLPNLPKLQDLPWFTLVILLGGVLALYGILSAPKYREAFEFLIAGLQLTITLALSCFALAVVLGLIAGLGRVSKNRFVNTVASLYVGVVRGVPMLVLILYVAYVAVPIGLSFMNVIGQLLLQLRVGWAPLGQFASQLAELNIRDVDVIVRGVAALAFSYGAFEAEVYRAGIESIPKGQMEAARSLGMTYPQTMIHIILPQALRVVLPPMANDFIAMVKDTSLLSVLGVHELTQLGKLYRATTFQTYEIWNTVAFLYLVLTILLQFLARFIETKMGKS